MEEQFQQQSQQQLELGVNNLPALDNAMTIGDRAKYILATAGTTGLGAAALGFGEFSFILAAAGGVAGFAFSDTMRNFIIDRAPAPRKARTRKSKLNWWLTGEVKQSDEDAPEPDEENDPESLDQEPDERDDDVFALEHREQPLPCERLQMKDIIAHIPANSYRLYLGRSVLLKGYPARSVNILKQHLKLIGASQKGKSSMAGCLLEQIIQTHDLYHALIAILDLEDKTGKLFENDPHIVTFRMDGRDVKMHARTKEQVQEYLGYIVQLMDYRYTLSTAEIAEMPLLIVYIEEFLALKDYFKRRISWAEDKEQAQKDYDTLIYNISELARRGLKARIQLLLCAQVDYRDEDLYEALANITAGMSFCVRSTAAQAAGFTDADMLKKNHKDNIIGQAVAEFSGCKDMVLAPDFDLEQKLITLETKQAQERGPNEVRRLGFDRDAWPSRAEPLAGHFQQDRGARSDGRPSVDVGGEEERMANVRAFPKNGEKSPVESSDSGPKEYRLTEEEIKAFIAAYKLCGNIERSLSSINRGGWYKKHAGEIVRVHGLRKDA